MPLAVLNEVGVGTEVEQESFVVGHTPAVEIVGLAAFPAADTCLQQIGLDSGGRVDIFFEQIGTEDIGSLFRLVFFIALLLFRVILSTGHESQGNCR